MIGSTDTIDGTYGSSETPCVVFVYRTRDGFWYAVEGSLNVNHTCEWVGEGAINVETLQDDDFFTASVPIDSEEILLEQVEE